MKPTPQMIAQLETQIATDLAEIARTSPGRIVRDLAEQVRSGGERKMNLKIIVEFKDQDPDVKVATSFSWERTVKTTDSYVPHVIADGTASLPGVE